MPSNVSIAIENTVVGFRASIIPSRRVPHFPWPFFDSVAAVQVEQHDVPSVLLSAQFLWSDPDR